MVIINVLKTFILNSNDLFDLKNFFIFYAKNSNLRQIFSILLAFRNFVINLVFKKLKIIMYDKKVIKVSKEN
mgnify:CR=1 FL=1